MRSNADLIRGRKEHFEKCSSLIENVLNRIDNHFHFHLLFPLVWWQLLGREEANKKKYGECS